MLPNTTIIHVPRASARNDAHRTGTRPSRLPFRRPSGWQGLPAAALSVSLFHASRLLGAGVPLLDTLDDLVAQERHAGVRQLWHRVRSDVVEGQTLSSALADQGSGLNAGYLAALAAGEASGALGAALADVEQQLRRDQDLGMRLRNALIYPLMTLLVVGAASLWLVWHVAPSVRQLNRSLQGPPSALSGPVADPSDWVPGLLYSFPFERLMPFLPWLSIGGVGLVVLFMLLAGWHPHTAHLRARIGRRVPVIGTLHTQSQCAVFCRVMASMMSQGVGLLSAWPLAQAAVSHRLLRAELGSVHSAVLDGVPVGQAVRGCRIMPAIVARLVAAGDSAGALDAAFAQAGEQLTRSVKHDLARLEQLLQPVLLLLIGGLLAWLVGRVLGPAYSLLLAPGALP